MKAAFFAANLQPMEEGCDKKPGDSLLTERKSSRTTANGFAKDFAGEHGLILTDEGRPEYSSRFPSITSFGVKGYTQRLFVWA